MAAAEKAIEMAAMGPGGGESKSALAAPASGASKSNPDNLPSAVSGYTVGDHNAAIADLEGSITGLYRARQHLDMATKEVHKHYPKLNTMFTKQGTSAHHKKRGSTKYVGITQAHALNRFPSSMKPLHDLQYAHAIIPEHIKAVREAHEALLAAHPHLASKSGKIGAQRREFVSPTGEIVSVGNYHGKTHTTPSGVKIKGVHRPGHSRNRTGQYEGTSIHRLFGGRKTRKGGRKTRKHRRKHRRKTRKHRRKHRRHHKTKRRKHHRRKHKRKTRRH